MLVSTNQKLEAESKQLNEQFNKLKDKCLKQEETIGILQAKVKEKDKKN